MMRDPVAVLLFVSLLAIVFPTGNQGYNQEDYAEEEKYIREDFALMDQNKADYVDTKEYSNMLKTKYVEYAFKKYDVDGDGKMNYEEYKEEYRGSEWKDYLILPR